MSRTGLVSQETVQEDLSHPISESYFHLSQDDVSDLSITTSIGFDTSNLHETHAAEDLQNDAQHDTSMLIHLAQSIDKENIKENYTDSNPSPENYAEFKKSEDMKLQDNTNGIQYDKPELAAPQVGSPRQPTATFSTQPKYSHRISPPSLISSHSTPLMSRKVGGPNSLKWSKYSKDNYLPEINESHNDDSTANEIVRPASSMSHSRNLSKHSRMNSYNTNRMGPDDDTFIQQPSQQQHQPQQPQQQQQQRYTLEELMETVLPHFSDQISAKVQETIASLVHPQQLKTGAQIEKHNHRQGKDVFITPIRSHTDSLNSSSEEDDDLSLTGVHNHSNERKKFSVNHDGSIHTHENPVKQGSSKDAVAESPVTTPPHSQEYSESKAHVRDFFQDDNKAAEQESEIRRLKKEIERLGEENLDLKIDLNELQLRMSEQENQRAHKEMDGDVGDESLIDDKKEKFTELEATVLKMKKELHRTKQEKEELANELGWYKNNKSAKYSDMGIQADLQAPVQQEGHERPSATNDKLVSQLQITIQEQEAEMTNLRKTTQGMDRAIDRVRQEVQMLQAEIGDPQRKITIASVDPRFQHQYSKLQLHKVDQLTKIEMANLIKNIMLSLLISDFDQLPNNAAKYGKFLRMAISFLDTMHQQMYTRPAGARPSDYLRKQGDTAMADLEQCLKGMEQWVNRQKQ